MNAKEICRSLARLAVMLSIPAFVWSCERIRDDMDGCGIYLEFVYDRNMEYADAFAPHVAAVDVFIFDADGRYLFTKSAARAELIGGNRMFIGRELTPGQYKVLTVGGLSDDFSVSDGEAGALVAGRSSIDDIRISLDRGGTVIDREFSPLWVGKAVDINNRADLSVWRVGLVKNTNRFNLVLVRYGDTGTRTDVPDYTFRIETPEGAVYGCDNSPLTKESVTYEPYYLAAGAAPDELSVARLNTMRLLKKEGYRIVVSDTRSGETLLDRDLIKILSYLKPDRPDGTALPMQEFLDRKSEWDIVLLYKEVPSGGGGEGYIAIGLEVGRWIVWFTGIDV